MNFSDLPLFSGLSEAETARLLRFAKTRRCAPGTLLFEQGELPEYLHVVVGGIIELFTPAENKELGLMLLSAGDVFMPAAALFDEPYLNSARALSSARLLLLPAEAARDELVGCHGFAVNVSRLLAGHFRMAARQIIDLKCRTAPQRLADFLLRIADETGQDGAADLPVPKRTLAHRVGMSPETLSRSLQMLADHGLLLRGRKILIRDRAKILAFCGVSPHQNPSETGLDVHIF